MFEATDARCRAALVAGFVWLASPAQAQTQTDLQDRYWIEGSGFWADVDSTANVRATGQTGLATQIDFESDLALSRRRVLPSISLGTRRDSGWIIGFDAYSLRRSGRRSISRDITFDGVTYPASAQVSSSFNSDIFRLTVGHQIIARENFELGAALGVHLTNFEVSLSGAARIGETGTQAQARRRDLLAPLPTIGLFATWLPTDRLSVSGRVDYLSLKIGDYDGRLVNTQASIGYRLMDHVGVGVMYRYVDYRVGVDKDKWQGEVQYRFHGPAAFVRVGF